MRRHLGYAVNVHAACKMLDQAELPAGSYRAAPNVVPADCVCALRGLIFGPERPPPLSQQRTVYAHHFPSNDLYRRQSGGQKPIVKLRQRELRALRLSVIVT